MLALTVLLLIVNDRDPTKTPPASPDVLLPAIVEPSMETLVSDDAYTPPPSLVAVFALIVLSTRLRDPPDRATPPPSTATFFVMIVCDKSKVASTFQTAPPVSAEPFVRDRP